MESQKHKTKKVESKLRHLKADYEKLETSRSDLESQLKVAKDSCDAELKQKQEVCNFELHS